ncbi:MAG: hypothetical protein KKA31_00345 [Candidatus Margulisbacteria bacterium]|nr:hypothetical protein [Candidatus Margulisiibacteriota bacterium]
MPVTNAVVPGVRNDFGIDIKSSIQAKYNEFINVFLTMGKAMKDQDTEVTFPMFPNTPVSSTDPSFSMFASFSMNQLEQQMETLIKAEQFKTQLDQKAWNLFG